MIILEGSITALLSNFPGATGRFLSEKLNEPMWKIHKALSNLQSEGLVIKTGKTNQSKFYLAD